MTYVVVEMCVDCKYTDCAAVCPVEAFHELPDRLISTPTPASIVKRAFPNVRWKRSSPTTPCLSSMRTGRRSISTKRQNIL